MANEAHNEAVEAISDKLFGNEVEETPVDEVVEEEVEVSEDSEEQEEAEVEGTEGKEETTEEAATELFEIQLGDNVYEVPQEIKEELDKAQDYTQKTQATSAERKAVEAQRAIVDQEAKEQAFLKEVTPEINEIQVLATQVEQWKQHKRDNIDNLSIQDIVKIDSQIEQMQESGNALRDGVRIKYDEHQQAQEQSQKELLVKSTEALKSRIPEWGETHIAQAKEFGQSVGFTEAELANATDPREMEVLYKAAQYDRLQKGKGAAIKKVQSAPSITPKARRSDAQNAVTGRLNTRKAIKNAKGNKAKSNIIQDDIAKRLGL